MFGYLVASLDGMFFQITVNLTGLSTITFVAVKKISHILGEPVSYKTFHELSMCVRSTSTKIKLSGLILLKIQNVCSSNFLD
jgi:hypothetical protein